MLYWDIWWILNVVCTLLWIFLCIYMQHICRGCFNIHQYSFNNSKGDSVLQKFSFDIFCTQHKSVHNTMVSISRDFSEVYFVILFHWIEVYCSFYMTFLFSIVFCHLCYWQYRNLHSCTDQVVKNLMGCIIVFVYVDVLAPPCLLLSSKG